MERTCLRKAHRSNDMLRYCSSRIFKHISKKGYDRVIIHAKPKLARLWRSLLGFVPVNEKDAVLFDKQKEPYVELIKYIDSDENAITEHMDIAILFRIEGQWDTALEYE
jgi:hypothetical protein